MGTTQPSWEDAHYHAGVRRETAVLLRRPAEEALRELRATPRLQPYFREVGNQFVEGVLSTLIGELEGLSGANTHAGEAIARALERIREALHFGANPYHPKFLLLMASRLKRESHVLAFVRGCVEMGIDPKYEETILLKNIARSTVLEYLLSRGVPWSPICTVELAARECVGVTLHMLCRTGRILSLDDLVHRLYHGNVTRGAGMMGTEYYRKLDILVRWAIPIPTRWLVDDTNTSRETWLVQQITYCMNWDARVTTDRARSICSYYRRACLLAEALPREPVLRHQLALYVMRTVLKEPYQ